MFLKIHRASDGQTIVAVCDKELINTTITDGDLTISITDSFYGDRAVPEEEVVRALKDADNANIMGERSVTLAVDKGFIARDSCMMIGNIPHAQVFRL